LIQFVHYLTEYLSAVDQQEGSNNSQHPSMPTRARKSSKAPAASTSSTAAADTATALASQLLDDTISLAVEDNATADAATFAAFIVDMLPPEVLETLKAVAGFDVDDVEPPSPSHSTSSSSSPVNAQDLAFWSEVWAERVAPDDPLPGDDGGGASSLCSSYECELCDRVIQTTRHHLHPRETHAWLQNRDPAHYTDTLLGTTVNLCRMVRFFSFVFERLRCGRHFVFLTALLLGVARRQCHSAVHRFYPNRVLAEEYYTLELLLSR